MKLKERLPFNLQFFAEGDSAAGEPPKTFSQEEVNGVVAAESKKAVENFLKELGFEGEGNAVEQTKAFKEWQESQKTDLQKAKEAEERTLGERDQLKAQNNKLELQLECVKGGCSPEAIEDVSLLASTLVSDTVTMEEAVKQILEKYPLFRADGQGIIGKTPTDGKSTPSKPKESSSKEFIAAIKENQSKRR